MRTYAPMIEETQRLPKLLVLLGPTASGKTDWALRLAGVANAEIISADSRQIYKKMDIGTAKPKGEWRRNGLRKTFFVDTIPHHLIDVFDPGKAFSVVDFRDLAFKYCKLAHKQGRVPMIVGGTGLFISSVVDNLQIPRVPANKKFRKSLEEKSREELVALLRQLDPDAAGEMDLHNVRRIIRALEVCVFTGEPFSKQRKKGEPLFDMLQIGIDITREALYRNIDARTDEMIRIGLVHEIKDLLRQKYSWRMPSMSGIGYREFREYFEGKSSLDHAVSLLKRDIRRYARRQMTWFRRDKRIVWCNVYEEAEKRVQEFLSL